MFGNEFFSRELLRIAVFASICAVLAGCASNTNNTPQQPRANSGSPRPIADTVFELIRAAENANPQQANTLRLRAAEIAVAENNLSQAANIVATLNLPVDPDLQKRFALVMARIELETGNGLAALDWLRKPAITRLPLSESEQIMLGQLRADAYTQARSYLASARERIFLNPLLKGEARLQNQEAIFASLLAIPADNLTDQANRAITSELRGWLSLAAMTKQFQSSPMQQLEALNQWRQVWSNHPAAQNLPERLRTLSTVVENQAQIIALFLPLNGDLSPFGRAIRDAIIASRFQLGRAVDVQIYDTNNADMPNLINLAVKNGAQLGIGPLDRKNVTEMAKIAQLPLPILALNRTLDGTSNPNLYQFALAPEDEMIQVADQVHSEGKRNALVIYPDNTWGERNVTAFQDRWQSLGGNIVNRSAFSGQKDYSTLVKTLLDVDLSETRATNLRRIIGQSFEFTPRRRQDIDFVFLLANQGEARGINPTLAFYYAEDIPVYSTSHVYAFSDSKIESIDLNGIRFCDMPWKLGTPSAARSELQSLWPASRSNLAPFYALGVDAFHLYPRLEQMKRLSDDRIYGETGILQLDSNNVLNRTLAWAQFSDGEVIPIPQVVSTQ